MSKRFDTALDEWKEQIDMELETIVSGTKYPAEFKEVLRYALFPGGKRLRPILFLAWHELFADTDKYALRYACAIEILHTYSLVHDDMPCMDNDDFRRGKPSLHKKYGEGMALLAGDALMDLAYAVMNAPAPRCDKTLLNYAAFQTPNGGVPFSPFGDDGLICGQYYDLYGKIDNIDVLLSKVHALKTGALISFACTSGAALGRSLRYKAENKLVYSTGADCAPILDTNDEDSGIVAAVDFGKAFGVAFQLYDDVSEYIAGEKLSETSALNFIDLERAKTLLNSRLNDAAMALHKVRNLHTEFLCELLDKFVIA